MPKSPTLLVIGTAGCYAEVDPAAERLTLCVERCMGGVPNRLELLAGGATIPANRLHHFGLPHKLAREVGEESLPHVLGRLLDDARDYARAHGAPYVAVGELEHLQHHARFLRIKALLLVEA